MSETALSDIKGRYTELINTEFRGQYRGLRNSHARNMKITVIEVLSGEMEAALERVRGKLGKDVWAGFTSRVDDTDEKPWKPWIFAEPAENTGHTIMNYKVTSVHAFPMNGLNGYTYGVEIGVTGIGAQAQYSDDHKHL